MNTILDERKKEEQAFHDGLRDRSPWQRWSKELEETFKANPDWVNMKYYAVERKSRQMVLDWLRRHCRDKAVLDYCCGNGEDGIFIAKNGAGRVTGIDISQVSVENCRKRAVEEGVSANTSFHIMDAEAMQFDDDSFDIITEYGALHHLDLHKACSELARVLKEGGKMICSEALGHNPVIHLYRKRTPRLRTRWEVEHILRRGDMDTFRQYFRKVEVHFFHLATLAAVPFRNLPVFSALLGLLESVDDILLRIPLFKWQAWQAVIILSRPVKKV